MKFHCAMSEITGKDWLLKSLRRIIVPYFTFSGALRLERPYLTLKLFTEHHEMYLDYLEGRYGETAKECVSFHLGMLTTAQSPEQSSLVDMRLIEAAL